MKIINQDDNIIIYINKDYSSINEDNLEDSLTKIFYKLKEFYSLSLKGYFDTNVYIDSNYGMIIEMNKEDVDFIDYYDNQIDMRTTIKKVEFLYKIEDNYYFDLLKNDNFKIFLYKNNIYIKINKQINKNLITKILEHSSIKYNEDIDLITNYGKLVNM